MEFIFLTFFITTVMIGVARSSSTVKGPESDLSLTSSAESLPVEEITEKVEISATTTNNLFYDLFSKCYNFFFGNYDSKSTSSDIVESVPEIVKDIPSKTIDVVESSTESAPISPEVKITSLEEIRKFVQTSIKTFEDNIFKNFYIFLDRNIYYLRPFIYKDTPINEIESANEFLAYIEILKYASYHNQENDYDFLLTNMDFASQLKFLHNMYGNTEQPFMNNFGTSIMLVEKSLERMTSFLENSTDDDISSFFLETDKYKADDIIELMCKLGYTGNYLEWGSHFNDISNYILTIT